MSHPKSLLLVYDCKSQGFKLYILLNKSVSAYYYVYKPFFKSFDNILLLF